MFLPQLQFAEVSSQRDDLTPALPDADEANSQGQWLPWAQTLAAVQQLDAQIGSLVDKFKQVEDGLKAWEPLRQHDAKVAQLYAQLTTLKEQQRALEVSLRLKRATLLAQMGRDLDARADHLKILELDPSHRLNLIGLGLLLTSTGHRKAARTVYSKAIEHHPRDLICRVNLGALLIEEDPAAARAQYEAALAIDPDFLQAHGGMYYALSRLGQSELAEIHRRKCFGRQSVFPVAYRGNAQPIPVLLFVSSRGGNTPVERFLSDRVFQTNVVVTDFFDAAAALPPHQLAINGIGDVDVASEALGRAESLLTRTSAPVLNPPDVVRATSRCDIARRLCHVPGVLTPRTITLSRESLAPTAARTTLLSHELEFPILLRTPGFHGGENFLRVETFRELPDVLANLPGRDLTVIQYLDARGRDNKTRKYRVMMIDGQLYPLHLAISHTWKVHYFSAEMSDFPEHRAEDAEFLSNMEGLLGNQAVAALEQIQKTLSLDYGGIDFGLNDQGQVLLFEANATMGVLPPEADECWDYRRPAVDAIYSATLKMLVDRAAAVPREPLSVRQAS